MPLQGTLPGWPQAQDPTGLQILGLLIGVPGVFFLIVVILAKARGLVRAGRGEPEKTTDEPLWLGSAPSDRAELTVDSIASSGGRRALVSASDAASVGGASARW